MIKNTYFSNHILTIIFLLFAIVAFILQFYVVMSRVYCEIAAFALPMLAALMEIHLSEKSNREAEKRIEELEENQLSVHVEGETLFLDKGKGDMNSRATKRSR